MPVVSVLARLYAYHSAVLLLLLTIAAGITAEMRNELRASVGRTARLILG